MMRSITATILLSAALVLFPLRAQGEELTLRSCLDDASRANPDLAVARFDPQIHASSVTLARSSTLPRVDLQGGYTLLARSQAVRFGTLTQETQESRFPSLSLTATQILYDFGKRGARVESEKSLLSAAEHGVEQLRQELSLKVVEAFYGYARAEALVTVSREEVEMRRRHLRDVEELLAAGVVIWADKLQAEVKLAESRQNLLSAETALENARLLLNHLTGRPPAARWTLRADQSLPDPPDPTVEHPELKRQQRVIDSLEHQIREAETAGRPDIFLRLSAEYVENDHVREQVMYAATLGLSVDLYDGDARSSRAALLRTTLDRERKRLEAMRSTLRLERETARNDVALAQARLDVSSLSVDRSAEHLRIATERYRERVGTATEVIDAQTLLTAARTRLADDRFRLGVARARLMRADGTL